jgi:glycosyltransferase involved in cell wall biosynthesis
MRILHLVHQYPPDFIGGVELYTQALATAQAARGHAVTVFSPSMSTPTSTENGVIIQRVPLGARSAPATFFSTFKQAALSEAWRVALLQTQPDLVHVQHLMGVPVTVMDELIRQKIPYLVTLHDYYYACANAMLLTNYDQSICDGPRAWINCGRCALARAGYDRLAVLSPGVAPVLAYRHARLRHVLDHARCLIAPTEFVRDQYQRQFHLAPDRIRVIPHGIEAPPYFRPLSNRQPPSIGEGQPTDRRELRIAYIGGLASHKGVHVLIDVMNQLPDTARLTIYGDLDTQPEYVAKLSARAHHPRIEFAGRLPHAELYAAFDQIDVVVAPSLCYETSALIVQEAAAARVPVIASDLGALRETTLKSGGLVFPTGDVGALRSLLQSLIDEPGQLDRLRANLKEPRSMDTHVTEIEAVYHAVVSP